MKQTAVEWLEKRFLETEGNLYAEDFTKAKEMEKQQIVEAYDEAECKIIGRGEQYYNETFKSE